MSKWDLFSSHGLVLIFFARNPRARLRDAAEAVGITERAVQNNIRDLAASGHLIIEKVGRCNRYKVMGRKHLPHPTTRSVPLRQLLRLFKTSEPEERDTAVEVIAKTSKKPIVEKAKPASGKTKVVTAPKIKTNKEPAPVPSEVPVTVTKKPEKSKQQVKNKTDKETPALPQQDLLF